MNQNDPAATSALSARLGAVERLFVHLEHGNHHDEADALMTIDVLMRIYLHDDEPLTKDAMELRGMLFEVLESWLPKDVMIVDA